MGAHSTRPSSRGPQCSVRNLQQQINDFTCESAKKCQPPHKAPVLFCVRKGEHQSPRHKQYNCRGTIAWVEVSESRHIDGKFDAILCWQSFILKNRFLWANLLWHKMVKVQKYTSMEYIHFSHVFFAIFHTSMALMFISHRQKTHCYKANQHEEESQCGKARNIFNCTSLNTFAFATASIPGWGPFFGGYIRYQAWRWPLTSIWSRDLHFKIYLTTLLVAQNM
jgi:hypothetical protein